VARSKLLERAAGEITEQDDYQADYGSRGDRWALTLQAVRLLGAGPVAAHAGLNRRTLERVIKRERPSVAHRANQARIAQAAAHLASEALRTTGHPVPTSTFAILTEFIRMTESGIFRRLCQCGCGRPLPNGHRVWFEEACRARARRRTATDG
jgi:hypothetical protein